MNQIYRLFLASLALLLLLPASRSHDAFAASVVKQGHGKHATSVHAASRHVGSSGRRVQTLDRGAGSYRPQLQQSKSEWRQAQRRGNQP